MHRYTNQMTAATTNTVGSTLPTNSYAASTPFAGDNTISNLLGGNNGEGMNAPPPPSP
jgi:hypothetical protein